MQTPDRLDVIVGLAKRRGFVYPAAEIYGGPRHAWDYGPLGVELRNNIRRQWWRAVVTGRDDVVGLDSCAMLPAAVWETSGHTDVFAEPLTQCQSCGARLHGAEVVERYTERHDRAPDVALRDVNCPACGTRGSLTPPRMFSGLMSTRLAADETGRVYLRPELSQGILINFAQVQQSARRRPPFGIAQVGRVFRNEIAPAHWLFRTREFEQATMEYFVKPGDEEEWCQYWIAARMQWYIDYGVSKEQLRLVPRPANSLPVRCKTTVDIEYRFDLIGDSWGRLEAVSDRGATDLVTHARATGADLSHFDQENQRRWTPSVVEAVAGVDRAFLCFLLDAYYTDDAPNTKGGRDRRVVLRLDHRLAPVKVAVLPLSRNSELSPRARQLADTLRQHWTVEFDDAGAIGRRYRRQDEIGTPYCITLDFETVNDNAATVRERDTMTQSRVGLDQLEGYLARRLVGC